MLLCIDTASAAFAVLAWDGGQVLAAKVCDPGHDHTQLLVSAIDEVLVAAGRQPERVAVVRGPGSYAGIRVGMATAAGFALARGIRVTGVGTLEAVAAAAGPGHWLVVHPAGRDTYAARTFVDGEAAGPMTTLAAAELAGQPTAGEFPGATREVSVLERCTAAARLADAIPAGDGPVEALYLREPSITVSRRQPAAAKN